MDEASIAGICKKEDDMKILLITLEYPPQRGGVASYWAGLVGELQRQGYTVEVISTKLLGRWLWPRWLRGYFTVRKEGKRTKYDYLFVGQVLPLGTIAYLLRKRTPYVVFTHGMDVLMAQKSWRKQRLLKKILAQAKLVVANSEFTRGEIEKIENRKWKIEVVYPCPTIDPEVKPEDVELVRRKLGLTGKKVMLTLGRVVERKGHDLALKAMPEILKHVPNAVYVVAGDGPYLAKLAKLTEDLKIQPAVRFVGQIADDERAAYYSMCDLFVMPSRQIGPDVEGFGLAFLEAALFGKPSVGGWSGGQGEAILDGKTGVLVDPTDANALARVCVQLLNDEVLRSELGKNAKARVLHEFTWGKQVGILLEKLAK